MQYLPIGALLGLILLVELFFVIGIWSFAEDGSMLATVVPIPNTTNTHALGNVFTLNVYLFQAAGLILLIAMIGAIVLTLRSR